MKSLLTISKAQDQLREQVKVMRLSQGLTQEGLANRAGVALPTLRRFEQKGLISLEAFLKILMVLGSLEAFVGALENDEEPFEDRIISHRLNLVTFRISLEFCRFSRNLHFSCNLNRKSSKRSKSVRFLLQQNVISVYWKELHRHF